MTREEFLNLIGDFSWNYGNKFFIETSFGNFTWSDPEYFGGTNQIRPFKGTCFDFIKIQGIPYLRDKGKKSILDFCGEDVELCFDLNDFSKEF